MQVKITDDHRIWRRRKAGCIMDLERLEGELELGIMLGIDDSDGPALGTGTLSSLELATLAKYL